MTARLLPKVLKLSLAYSIMNFYFYDYEMKLPCKRVVNLSTDLFVLLKVHMCASIVIHALKVHSDHLNLEAKNVYKRVYTYSGSIY